MPELPEVELFKEYLDLTSLNTKIKEVKVKNPEILGNISVKEFENKLKDRIFISTYRHGKYVFIKTDANFWVIIHFGMTGNLKYFDNINNEPSHSRILITFGNGYYLSYDCQRKFGEVDITKTVEDFVKAKNLGPDVLNLDFKNFKKILEKRTGKIKSVFMNQHIIAGLGNLYTDEILFQAEINPNSKINKIDEESLKKIFREIKKVLRISIDRKTNFENFPNNYLIPHRSKGGKCPKGDKDLKIIKISGRTTYYCPRHQKELK